MSKIHSLILQFSQSLSCNCLFTELPVFMTYWWKHMYSHLILISHYYPMHNLPSDRMFFYDILMKIHLQLSEIINISLLPNTQLAKWQKDGLFPKAVTGIRSTAGTLNRLKQNTSLQNNQTIHPKLHLNQVLSCCFMFERCGKAILSTVDLSTAHNCGICIFPKAHTATVSWPPVDAPTQECTLSGAVSHCLNFGFSAVSWLLLAVDLPQS